MTGVSLWLLFTALTLSTVSAYYSIVGLAAIFAASFWPVLILATTLEVGKLVLVSWLYRNWRDTPWPIRTYLTVAVITLMLITSLGIFGFLSKAHSEDQTQGLQNQLQITQINTQIETRQQQLTESRQTLDQLNRSINIQLDANRAQQALANRRTQQAERDRVQARMDQLQTEILQLTEQRTQIQSTQTLQDSKLGPVRYVVALVNPDADPNSAVKWIILVLVLVCDPLAVCMLMAANQGYRNLNHMPIPTETRAQSTDSVRWDPVSQQIQLKDEQGVWHNLPASAVSTEQKPMDVIGTAQLVEMTVRELLSQRPIFELGAHAWQHNKQSDSDASQFSNQPMSLDLQQVQKLIENTLESWMNKTLTVTYTADQKDIDQIVEKVIQQTLNKSQTSESSTENNVTTEPNTSHSASENPQESDPTPGQKTLARPTYKYFGEDRVKGGKKHPIKT